MGHGQLLDSMINDGLWCSFENWHMGKAGEVVATECGIGRQAQDAYALESHRKAAAATDAGRFAEEILPVTIPQKKGDADRLRARRVDPPRHDARGTGSARAGVREGRHRHRRQCSTGQRWSRGAGRDVEHAREGSGPDADGAHRRAGVERPRPEAPADDAGRSDPPRAREDGMEDGGRRSLRDQRGLLGPADRGDARARPRSRGRST